MGGKIILEKWKGKWVWKWLIENVIIKAVMRVSKIYWWKKLDGELLKYKKKKIDIEKWKEFEGNFGVL